MSRKRKRRQSGGSPNKHPPPMLRLKYDAAQTTPENVRHWSMADGLSADAANTPDVRRTLRNRARLEVANNSYARGMVLMLADVCIGTGPRLQMLSDDDQFNSEVEEEFVAWAEAVRLAEKLKTLRMSKITDGEAFAALVFNKKLNHPVKLDLRLIEADRVTSPHPMIDQDVDGILYDKSSNPIQYHVAAANPDDGSIWTGKFETIPADVMLHWYRPDRPGQSRGLPEIMPALPLFAQLRRYTLAVLAAAETAADFAAVIYTDSPAMEGTEAPTPYDLVSLEKRMATVMPDGWKIGQIRAEQPTTSYSEFKREILGEIGRCMQVPVNIVLGDSSKHNYASGRLDHQTFFKSIKIEQTSCEQVILFPLFASWFGQALHHNLFPNYHRGIIRPEMLSQHAGFAYQHACWFWDGLEHVDPMKEAKAAVARVHGNLSNLAIECAKTGNDWEDVLVQKAREQERMRELGLAAPIVIFDTHSGEEDDKSENHPADV